MKICGIKKYIVVILACIFLEIFLFNFQFWNTKTKDEIRPQNISSSLMEVYGDNCYIPLEKRNSIEIKNINHKIKNINVDIEILRKNHTMVNGDAIPIQLFITDEGNSRYLPLQKIEIVNGIIQSHVIPVHTIGKSKNIKIKFFSSNNEIVKINNITLNKKIPFEISIKRVFVLCFLGCLLVVVRPESAIYSRKLIENSKSKKRFNNIVILIVVLLNMLVLFKIGSSFNTLSINTDINIPTPNNQYNLLAHSLKNGKTFLEIDPPEYLRHMKNPYDTAHRYYLENLTGEKAMLDYAYYNGKYYCYFGIIPVLMFYLPYLMLTGHDLNTTVIVMSIILMIVPAVIIFMYSLVKKYYQDISLGLFLLLSEVLLIGSGILYSVGFPALYSLPIVLSIFLDILGLTCWLSSVRKSGENIEVDKKLLLLGGVCIALVIGCRPQLAIACLCAFPIFSEEIKQRLFFSKKGLCNTLCVIVPFFVVAGVVFLYNVVRFGSPIDFGATYNLTGFDMTHRGIVLERFWLGIFQYYFQPFNMNSRFPFFFLTSPMMAMVSDFQGQVINEPMMGGFFAFNLIGIMGFCSFLKTFRLKENKVYTLSLTCLISGILISLVDIQMVGMTFRYLQDFSFFILSSTVLCIISIDKYYRGKEVYSMVMAVIIILSILCIMLNVVTLIGDGRFNELRTINPLLFYKIKYYLMDFR